MDNVVAKQLFEKPVNNVIGWRKMNIKFSTLFSLHGSA
jgi:hypothetical protein